MILTADRAGKRSGPPNVFFNRLTMVRIGEVTVLVSHRYVRFFADH